MQYSTEWRIGAGSSRLNASRLLLASLVIFSHSYEIKSPSLGDPFRQAVGFSSFGTIAVNLFFLISGFLIVKSWSRSPDVFGFFRNRLKRIYPAYVVACLVSASACALWLGVSPSVWTADAMYRFVLGLAYLSAPVVPFNFEGSPYPGVNVPLWSIQYEFFCYCLVPLILLWRGRAREWYALTVLLCLLYVVARWPGAPGFFALFSGSLGRLLMFFFMGGVVYFALSLHRPRYLWLIVSAVAMVFSLKSEVLFELAMASFGAYLLFSMMWAPALNGSLPRLNADVSYGVYLYGWPISKMLYSASPEMSAPMNAAVSLALAIIAGSLSWVVVEERFLRRNRSHVALKTSHGHSEKGGE